MKTLDGVISDLDKAMEIGSANVAAHLDNTGLAYRFNNLKFNIKVILLLGLSYKKNS